MKTQFLPDNRVSCSPTLQAVWCVIPLFLWPCLAAETSTPGLRLIPPDRMNSSYTVGDVTPTEELSTKTVVVSAAPWPARLAGSIDLPTLSETSPRYSYVVMLDGQAKVGVAIPALRLASDAQAGKAAVLKVNLTNARTYGLSAGAIENSYVPRFRYWQKNARYLAGQFAVCELLVADEVEITANQAAGASAVATFAAMKKAVADVKAAGAKVTDTSIRITGKGIAVAYQVIPIPAPKLGADKKPMPVTFEERIRGGQEFEFDLRKQPHSPHDIFDPSEYTFRAKVRAEAHSLVLDASAIIRSTVARGAPRAFYAGDTKAAIAAPPYHDATKLQVSTAAHSELPGVDDGNGGGRDMFF
ncbi:MAG: hypothetical protein FJ399_13440, partial [Verrucomicrobia bacterium]|nr:hypothetical protein [Verrucomicrobiota bacterium]